MFPTGVYVLVVSPQCYKWATFQGRKKEREIYERQKRNVPEKERERKKNICGKERKRVTVIFFLFPLCE